MSLHNLGNKHTIILHNCETNKEKYDLLITPHKQTEGYIRPKRQTMTRKISSKQRQITRKRFSKRKNAVSVSETSNLEELSRLKDSINKIIKLMIPNIFLTQKPHHKRQYKENDEKKKTYKNKPVRLYNCNQPLKHIENYTLTVIKQKMSQNEESENENSILPLLINSPTEDRGQTPFCQNLIANLFEKGFSPSTAKFPEVKIKRQIFDHYLKGIGNIMHGIYTIEIKSTSKVHGK